MDSKTFIAAILIVLGILAFVYQGIDYTTRGKDVNIGSLHMQSERENRIPLPPILGAIALVSGFVILLVDKRGIGRPSTR